MANKDSANRDSILVASATAWLRLLTGKQPMLDSQPVGRLERRVILGWLCVLMPIPLITIVIVDMQRQWIGLGQGLSLIVIVFTFMLSLWMFTTSIESEKRLSIESHWGGLGGGLGGWRVSRALVFLVTTSITLYVLLRALNSYVPLPDLRERYRSAKAIAARKAIQCEDGGISRGKLTLNCAVPPGDAGTKAMNEVWDQIKLANALLDDITVNVTSAVPAQATPGGPGAASRPAAGAPTTTPTPAAPTPANATQPAAK